METEFNDKKIAEYSLQLHSLTCCANPEDTTPLFWVSQETQWSASTWKAAQAREVTRCIASSSSPPTSSGFCESTRLHNRSSSFTSPLRTRHCSSSLGTNRRRRGRGGRRERGRRGGGRGGGGRRERGRRGGGRGGGGRRERRGGRGGRRRGGGEEGEGEERRGGGGEKEGDKGTR